MRARSPILAVLLVAVACGGGGGPAAPAAGGDLVVTVLDPGGAPVAGATVRIVPGDRTATTDAAGTARFASLQARSYTVSARLGEGPEVDADVTLGPPYPKTVQVFLPGSTSGGIAIEWDGRTVPWGEEVELVADVRIDGGPAAVDVEWRSPGDLYLHQPVVLGHGTTLRTSALKPGSNAIEARLVRDDQVLGTATTVVKVAYRESWNVALEGAVPYPDQTTGDVWVSGHLALVARRGAGGISIVDLDAGPAEVGRFTDATLFTQDVKAADGIAYVSHEPRSNNTYLRSVTLVDITDPRRPVAVGGVSIFDVPNAHNVFVDGDLLEIASQGTHGAELYDVSDPTAPRRLGRVASRRGTAHDMNSRNGILYLSSLPLYEGQEGEMTIADVSDPAEPRVLSRILYPGAFTHSSWLSADGRTLYVADELVNAPIRIYDVSNPARPDFVGTYQPRLGTIPHNLLVRDDHRAYLAEYKHGVEVLDVSDPHHPRLVGFYDTHPGADDDSAQGALVPAHEEVDPIYAGAWGVHWTDDGRIVVSDLNRGLFVLRYTGS